MNRGTGGRRRGFRPLEVLDLELTAPRLDPTRWTGSGGARLLVRIGGEPVGYLDVGNGAAAASADEVIRSVVSGHTRELERVLIRQALDRMSRSRTPQQPHPSPLVSVAVCTRDRPAELERCLSALARLTHPRLDLIVVDNAPAGEASAELVRGFPTVRYVREPRPGLDWARNRAIAEARGEFLAFADDDVVVDADWVDRLLAVFREDPDVMAVTGLVAPLELETEAQLAFEQHRGWRGDFRRTWNRVDLGRSVARRYGAIGELGSGANMAFRTAIFKRLGGFDPALDVGTLTRGGGDLEMFFRVIKEGCTLVREPRAIVRHRHRRSFEELRDQLSTWSTGMYGYTIRSWQRYPDERLALAVLALRWLLLRNVRRLARAAFHTSLRTDLVWTEMKHGWRTPWFYHEARRRAAELESAHGPTPLAEPLPRPRPRPPHRQGVVTRLIELTEPVRSVEGFGAAKLLLLSVTLEGREIGTARIPRPAHRICAAELLDTIAEQLFLPLRNRFGVDAAALCRRVPAPVAEAS